MFVRSHLPLCHAYFTLEYDGEYTELLSIQDGGKILVVL